MSLNGANDDVADLVALLELRLQAESNEELEEADKEGLEELISALCVA